VSTTGSIQERHRTDESIAEGRRIQDMSTGHAVGLASGGDSHHAG
jgi:hypothetical protein